MSRVLEEREVVGAQEQRTALHHYLEQRRHERLPWHEGTQAGQSVAKCFPAVQPPAPTITPQSERVSDTTATSPAAKAYIVFPGLSVGLPLPY